MFLDTNIAGRLARSSGGCTYDRSPRLRLARLLLDKRAEDQRVPVRLADRNMDVLTIFMDGPQ